MKIIKIIFAILFAPLIALYNLSKMLYEKSKPYRCRHNWRYWDANIVATEESHLHSFRNNNHFRKCYKCGKQQKQNMMPGKINNPHYKDWLGSSRKLPENSTVVDVEIFTMDELYRRQNKGKIRNNKINSIIGE